MKAQEETIAKLGTILDSLSAHICLLDEEGNIEMTNRPWQTFAKQHGAKINRVTPGINYLHICDQAQGEAQQTARAFARGIRAVMNREREYFEQEYPCHTPDEELWFMGRVTPFEADASTSEAENHKGGKRKVVVAHENITEQKLARRKQEMARQILSQTIDMVTQQDEDMHIIWANEAVESYLQKPLEQLKGQKCHQAWYGSDSPCSYCPVREAMASGQSKSKEIKDSNERHFLVVGSPMIDETGHITGALKTNIEITEQRLLEKELDLKEQAMESSINAIGLADDEAKLMYVNQVFLELLGYENEEELLGSSLLDFWHQREKGKEMLDTIFSGAHWNGETKIVRKDGELIEVNFLARAIQHEEGSHISIVASFIDVSERKETERSLIRFRNAMDTSADSIFIIDYPSYRFIDVNKNACLKLGYSKKELLQLTPFDIMPHMHATELRGKFEWARKCQVAGDSKVFPGSGEEACIVSFETYHMTKNGTTFPVELNLRFSDIPEEPWFIATARDITRRKQAEDRLRYLSYHDSLTGLYNRSFLEEEMERLDVARQLPLSIIMADINGLKLVNDTYGHKAGDQLLKTISDILQKACRKEDILARWGGDEFVIFLPQTDQKHAETVAQRIKSQTVDLQMDSIPVKVSLGTGTKESQNSQLEDAFKVAEDNMYQNKLMESNSARSDIISALLATLKEKSDETEEHSWRMTQLGFKFGQALGLSEAELDKLSLLATIHDIGKVTISEEVLKKPGELNEEEWEKVKEHPETGQRIARTSENLIHVAEEILAHHEHWDGSGYPRGLKGTEIPLLARVLAIIDAYDVITNGRSYKQPASHRDALSELKRCAGHQFDPNLVDTFVQIMDQDEETV